MGWPLMLQTTVGAARNTSRPYSEHCKGGWLSGSRPIHGKSGSNVSRPYSGGGALLVKFSGSVRAC